MSDNNPAHHRSSLGRLILSLILLILAAGLLLNRQAVLDHINTWLYQPSAEIQQIVADDTMTDKAKFYFYASRAEVDDRTQFNKACSSVDSEQTAVLGCYAGQRIYIFNVTDKRLNGIKQVTAAHEMLHAAYQRLDPDARQQVDKMIEAEAKSNDNQTVKDLIKIYDKTEPGERLNELHSIFGSQVTDLSPELEQYYGRYFKDRSEVIEMYQQYHSVFDEIKAKQDQLVAELGQLADQIKALESAYLSDASQLNRDIADFNARASNGQMSRSEYNNERADLKQRQAALSSQADLINQKVDLYNVKREQLLAINAQAVQLNHSIDSNLPTIKGVK